VYSFHVVPQLRESLMKLEKPSFDDDTKEEAALYKRSLEVCPKIRIQPFIQPFTSGKQIISKLG
jgi:hypothetical protein